MTGPSWHYQCGPDADRSRHLWLASLRFSSCEPTALNWPARLDSYSIPTVLPDSNRSQIHVLAELPQLKWFYADDLASDGVLRRRRRAGLDRRGRRRAAN